MTMERIIFANINKLEHDGFYADIADEHVHFQMADMVYRMAFPDLRNVLTQYTLDDCVIREQYEKEWNRLVHAMP